MNTSQEIEHASMVSISLSYIYSLQLISWRKSASTGMLISEVLVLQSFQDEIWISFLCGGVNITLNCKTIS